MTDPLRAAIIAEIHRQTGRQPDMRFDSGDAIDCMDIDYLDVGAICRAIRSTPGIGWRPIDDTARDGSSLWPVADASGSTGIAKFSGGKWRLLVHHGDGVPRFVAPADPAQQPVMYFDVPEPPKVET